MNKCYITGKKSAVLSTGATEAKRGDILQPFYYQNLMSICPYCLPYNFNDVSLENWVLDQPIIP